MLVLARKQGERIMLVVNGETIVLSVESVKGERVKLGFEAPDSVRIVREELIQTEGK